MRSTLGMTSVKIFLVEDHEIVRLGRAHARLISYTIAPDDVDTLGAIGKFLAACGGSRMIR